MTALSSGNVATPRLLPAASGLRRLWSATLAFCETFADAITEARVMQRAAYRRHPFLVTERAPPSNAQAERSDFAPLGDAL